MSVCPRDSLHFPLGFRQERYFGPQGEQAREVLSLLITQQHGTPNGSKEPVPPVHPFSWGSGSEFPPPPPPLDTTPTPPLCVAARKTRARNNGAAAALCRPGAPRGPLTWKPSVVTTWGAGGFLGVSMRIASGGHDFTTQHHTQP